MIYNRYQFAYIKYKGRRYDRTWAQVGENVYYAMPFGYIMRKIHEVFIDFKIFDAWLSIKLKKRLNEA